MLMAAIDTYLAIRRAAGFQLCVTEDLLHHFARFAAARGDDDHVRAQTALAWAASAPSPAQRGRRLEVVRIFARHAQLEDPRHEIPPPVFSARRLPYRPFIFTPAQLQQLLEQAAQLTPAGSLRPWTYCTLFSLLAVTGLRISEALSLRVDNLTAEGLLIQQTKFRKSRWVPLHPSTHAALTRYLERRQRFGGGDDHFFISLHRRALNYPTVVATFLAIVRQLGLHPGPGQRGPRLHDLRHTWAVRALQACPAESDQVSQHMLALMTYLGHAKLASTFVYLHTTPELLADIAERCEQFVQGELL